MRGFVAQTFPWPVVQFVLHPCHFLVTDQLEVRPLRMVLADQSVGIFIESALPGMIRVCEVHSSLQVCGNGFMSRKLFTVVKRDGVALVLVGTPVSYTHLTLPT